MSSASDSESSEVEMQSDPPHWLVQMIQDVQKVKNKAFDKKRYFNKNTVNINSRVTAWILFHAYFAN